MNNELNELLSVLTLYSIIGCVYKLRIKKPSYFGNTIQ